MYELAKSQFQEKFVEQKTKRENTVKCHVRTTTKTTEPLEGLKILGRGAIISNVVFIIWLRQG